jgi:hypothetical protein
MTTEQTEFEQLIERNWELHEENAKLRRHRLYLWLVVLASWMLLLFTQPGVAR